MRKARVRSEVLDKESLGGGDIINENTGIESDISCLMIWHLFRISFKTKGDYTYALKNIIKMYEEYEQGWH